MTRLLCVSIAARPNHMQRGRGLDEAAVREHCRPPATCARAVGGGAGI